VEASTGTLEILLGQLREGDDSARDAIINHSCERLRTLVRQHLRRESDLKYVEQTDDVLNRSMLHLHKALSEIKPENKRAFIGLASLYVQRELTDLFRKHFVGHGVGRHQKLDSQSADEDAVGPIHMASANGPGPGTQLVQAELIKNLGDAVDALPEDEREVFRLYYYQDLPQQEIADLLQVDVRTVKRRWRRAREGLQGLLGDYGQESSE